MTLEEKIKQNNFLLPIARAGKVLIRFFIRFIADAYERYLNPHSNLRIPNAKNGWSIVVITAGTSADSLNKLIRSAQKELQGSPYEIIIVGPANIDISMFSDIPLKHIAYKERKFLWIPGWITRKKNLGVEAAEYDKVVITHDYIIFTPGWKAGYDRFGNDWTACSNIFLNMDGTRHKDWIVYDYPGIGQALLPYDKEFTQYQYLNGAYFAVKRDFFLKNPLSEHLRWGEAEDVEWSKRIAKRITFYMNTFSTITYSKQKPGHNARWMENTRKLEELK